MQISVQDFRKKLPQKFIEELNEIFTPNYEEKILQGMLNKRDVTLRVNTHKSNIQEIMDKLKQNNIKFDRASFYKNALVLKNVKESDIYSLDIFEKGEIYLQSLSSMIPALVLNPSRDEKVLDMCSSPGGKTTLMSNLMDNTGEIIANELDKIRLERLQYNVNLQGASNVKTINNRGEILNKIYNNYFDKVLLDVPCSGEGRFLATNVQSYKSWSDREVNELSKLQKKLLKSAYDCLKENGELVYSTCTLNMKENEDIINYAINELGFKLEAIEFNRELNFIEAYNDDFNRMIYEKQESPYSRELTKAIRIIPNRSYEGFFVSKMKKYCKNSEN